MRENAVSVQHRNAVDQNRRAVHVVVDDIRFPGHFSEIFESTYPAESNDENEGSEDSLDPERCAEQQSRNEKK